MIAANLPAHSHVLHPRVSSFQKSQDPGQLSLGHVAPHGHGVVIHLIGQSFGSFTGGATMREKEQFNRL